MHEYSHFPGKYSLFISPLTINPIQTWYKDKRSLLSWFSIYTIPQDFRNQRASSPSAGRANTPQMGTASGYGQSQMGTSSAYGQSQFLHGKNQHVFWNFNSTSTATASPGPLARLQLDNMETMPYESPLSQRSTLRRDSHILAEISEMESSFTDQEQVDFSNRSVPTLQD